MDVVRYADSHGSEGDPRIPFAFRYRDYLIRAFNDDLPYDRFVREHVAGDLLEPRLDAEGRVNESALATAHWRLVYHGYLPTDPLDEKVRFVDDQINVLGKAFQAQTISCARCHDHKFDAISQADYTAPFGVLASCRPGILDANAGPLEEALQLELIAPARPARAFARDRLAGLDAPSLEKVLRTPGRSRGRPPAGRAATAAADPDWRARVPAPGASTAGRSSAAGAIGTHEPGRGRAGSPTAPGSRPALRPPACSRWPPRARPPSRGSTAGPLHPRHLHRHRGVLQSARVDLGEDLALWARG